MADENRTTVDFPGLSVPPYGEIFDAITIMMKKLQLLNVLINNSLVLNKDNLIRTIKGLLEEIREHVFVHYSDFLHGSITTETHV